MTDISYDESIATALATIPELRADYERECQNWLAQTPPPHVIYGSVLPTLIYRTETAWRSEQSREKGELLQRIFRHIEDLVCSSDFETRCLIEASLLETLLGESGGYQRFSTYFQSNTAEMARRVNERFQGGTQ